MEYCGTKLSEIKDLKKIYVCNGNDYLSQISAKELVKKNKHLPFYKNLRKGISIKMQGVLIRWLYRGLPFDRALDKIEGLIAENKSRAIKYNMKKRNKIW